MDQVTHIIVTSRINKQYEQVVVKGKLGLPTAVSGDVTLSNLCRVVATGD